MCKTYLDALSPDKSLGTLYGAIVGLSALGNHIVRTLLVPNLHSIQHRLQGVEVKVEGGASQTGQDGAMPPPASAPEPAGKRKRGNSIDGPSAAPVATKATSSGKRGSGKVAAALLQEERDVSMCKQALLRALGELWDLQYTVDTLRLTVLRSFLHCGSPQASIWCTASAFPTWASWRGWVPVPVGAEEPRGSTRTCPQYLFWWCIFCNVCRVIFSLIMQAAAVRLGGGAGSLLRVRLQAGKEKHQLFSPEIFGLLLTIRCAHVFACRIIIVGS
jgi:hypothetical protein